MSQTADAAIRAWILDNDARGCTAQSMIESLVAAGHPRAFAEQVVPDVLIDKQIALQTPLAEPVAEGQANANGASPAQADATAGLQGASNVAEAAFALAAARAAGPRLAVPEPLPHGPAAFVQTSDRRVTVLATLASPRIIVFGGVLSDAECDELVALSGTKLERSLIVDPATGVSSPHAERTSEGTFFMADEHPLVTRIDRRIAEIMRWPVENGEGLQILCYRPGGEYKPHFDYFDPTDPGSVPHVATGGNRVATLVVYLSDVAEGGATTFPEIGLEVAPVKGNAVFFSYESPTPASLTLHGGAPVKSGEKWIATKWVRERAYAR
jgi:prolyl 4-hydroxylase